MARRIVTITPACSRPPTDGDAVLATDSFVLEMPTRANFDTVDNPFEPFDNADIGAATPPTFIIEQGAMQRHARAMMSWTPCVHICHK